MLVRSKSEKPPVWISHRGRGQGYFDNSREGLSEALQNGFDAIEIDLRMSKDQHLVLFHDPNFRVFGMPSQCVETMTKNELQQLCFGQGEKLFFFEDFAQIFQGQEWVLDLKPESSVFTVEALIGYFDQQPDQLNRTRFLFWKQQDENHFRQHHSDVQVYARLEECLRAGLMTYFGLSKLGKIQQNRIYSLTPTYFGLALFKARLVKNYHKRGATTLAYLPQSGQAFEAAIEAGFDEILSDFSPRQALSRSSG